MSVIRLEKAIGMDGSQLYEKDTKTHQQRHIVLDEHSTALLRAHQARCQETFAALGVTFSDSTFVFSLEPDHSRPLKPASVTLRYKRMVKRLGIDTSIHKLRHYSATELIYAGVDIRTVAGRLGHGGGGTTTLKMYTAFINEADQRAAKSLLGRLPKPPVALEAAQMVEPTDPGPPQPKGPYGQIAAGLRGAMRCGLLCPGDPLPAMQELAARYGVALSTAHRAVGVLKEEGLVAASRGRRAEVAQQTGDLGTLFKTTIV